MNNALIYAILFAAFVGLASGLTGVKMGKEHVQQLWDAEKVVQVEKLNKAIADSRAKEQAAQAAVDQISKAKNAKLKTLSADYQRLSDSVSKRPDRPVGPVSESAGGGVGCTGASLSAPDAGFLARESARADRLRISLDACQAAYDGVRRTINAAQ